MDLRQLWTSFETSGIDATAPEEHQFRVRTVNLVGAFLLLFSLFWAVTFAIYGAFLPLVLVGGSALAIAACLVLLRRSQRVELVTHWILGIQFVAIATANWFTGGLTGSNDLALLCAAVLALFLLDRLGFIWVLMCTAIMIGFFVLEQRGFVFPQLVPADYRKFDSVLTWLTVFGLFMAITCLYERSHRHSHERLREATLQAEEANQAKTAFLANMSHEFRTPLNAILGLTEVTLWGPLSEKQRHTLGLVRSSAHSLLQLVEDMLDASHVADSALTLRPAPFDPRSLVEGVVDDCRDLADAKALALEVLFGGDLPTRVVGDRVRVRQILLHLVSNAIKFTPAGTVQIQLWSADGTLCFAVQDRGIGIPKEFAERIFSSSAQVDTLNGGRLQGLGVGLAICERLVEHMGGRIEYQRQSGRGSRFEVQLPLPAAPPPEDARSFSILAAEDDPVGRELLLAILRRAGHRVEAVADGHSAVNAALNGTYDVVLMDLQMPGLDGLETTQAIRRAEAGRTRTPILALTAYAFETERKRCLQAGMDDFIPKPIEPDMLLNAIRRWVAPTK